MIVFAQCPHRISLIGGGTDLDWFVKENGYGYALGFSIKRYSNVFGMQRGEASKRGILSYSTREEYVDINTISHPLIRETLKYFECNTSLEICSFGSPEGGQGLGGSSSFINALISTVALIENKVMDKESVAKIACEIEVERLRRAIGRQDQYLCALGGINLLKFTGEGNVETLPCKKMIETIEKMVEHRLFLVNTGIRRSASEVLLDIKERKSSSAELLNIREIIEDMINNMNSEVVTEDNLLSHIKETWKIKKNMAAVMNPKLLCIEDYLRDLDIGVLKLLGAGGGGFFLVETKHKEESMQLCKDKGLLVYDIDIDYDGVVVERIGR